jgi:hypothetical protein
MYYLLMISFNINLLHMLVALHSSLFSCNYPDKILYAFLAAPTCATCPVHLILLNLIVPVTVVEDYKECNIICSPSISSLNTLRSFITPSNAACWRELKSVKKRNNSTEGCIADVSFSINQFLGPITVVARYKDMNCLRPLKHWDRAFESRLRHGCLYPFILSMLSYVQVAALRRADPPSK